MRKISNFYIKFFARDACDQKIVTIDILFETIPNASKAASKSSSSSSTGLLNSPARIATLLVRETLVFSLFSKISNSLRSRSVSFFSASNFRVSFEGGNGEGVLESKSATSTSLISRVEIKLYKL